MAWTREQRLPAASPQGPAFRRTGEAARDSTPSPQFSHGMPVVRLSELGREQRTQILRVPFFSPSLGLRRWLALKLPPGYQPGQELPVVYCFRGHHFEWVSVREDASRQNPLPAQFEQAVQEARLPPAILVFPCFGSDDRKMFAIAANWSYPRAIPAQRGMGLGRFEDYLLEDLMPQLERSLGLYNPRRIAIGFSLGGLLAMQLSLRHPHLFTDVGTYDGSFFDHPVRPDDSILSYGIFEPIFGYPRNAELVAEHSPLALLQSPGPEHHRVRFYVQSGPERAEPNDSNFYRCRQVVQALEAAGITNHLPQVVEDGNHNWYTADRFAMSILELALRS